MKKILSLLAVVAAVSFVSCDKQGATEPDPFSNNGVLEEGKNYVLSFNETYVAPGTTITPKLVNAEDGTVLTFGVDYVIGSEKRPYSADPVVMSASGKETLYARSIDDSKDFTEKKSNNGKDESDKECILTFDKVWVESETVIVPTLVRKSDNKTLKYGEDYVVCSEDMCFGGAIKMRSIGETVLSAKDPVAVDGVQKVLANKVHVKVIPVQPLANKVIITVK